MNTYKLLFGLLGILLWAVQPVMAQKITATVAAPCQQCIDADGDGYFDGADDPDDADFCNPNNTGEGCFSTGSLTGTPGNCTSTRSRSIHLNQTLTTDHYFEVALNVGTTGPYEITSDTIDGVSFSASGFFSTTGNKTINLIGSGTPTSIGNKIYTVTYDTTTCQLRNLTYGTPPAGGSCRGDSEIVDRVSGMTGRVWMDRNLGASRAATSFTDYEAFGCLYQVGRPADGHEIIQWWSTTSGAMSSTTSTKSSSLTPGHSRFITSTGADNTHKWYTGSGTTINSAWTTNNSPCPTGYAIPSAGIAVAERWSRLTDTWLTYPTAGFMNNPKTGRRYNNGSLDFQNYTYYHTLGGGYVVNASSTTNTGSISTTMHSAWCTALPIRCYKR